MNRKRLAYLSALITLALGLLAFLNPWLMVRVVGFELLDGRGLSEMRATYGALFIAMAGVLLWAIPNRAVGRHYLRFGGFVWLGAALGRLASMTIDGALLPLNFVALALELVVALPLLLAGFQNERSLAGTPETEASPLDAYRS